MAEPKIDDIPLGHGLVKDDSGRYKIAVKGLTRGEALELLIVVHRLELYRTVMVDTEIVETAMRTMANIKIK